MTPEDWIGFSFCIGLGLGALIVSLIQYVTNPDNRPFLVSSLWASAAILLWALAQLAFKSYL